jgi:hypothetical protein
MIGLLAMGSIALAGCTNGDPEPRPGPTTSASAPAHSQPDASVAVTCAVVSIVLTTRQHAGAGLAQGSLTADQSRAILDTIPSIIRVALGAPGAKLNDQVSALLASATETPEANLETPEAARALSEIGAACEANETPIGTMGEGG